MKTNDEIYNEIKEKFDDCPELPESLKKENVVARLKSTEQRISFKKMASLAAMLAIVIISSAVAFNFFGDGNNDIGFENESFAADIETEQSSQPTSNEAADEKAEIGPLRKAASREEIEKIILKNYQSYKVSYYSYNGLVGDSATATDVNAETVKPGAATGSDSLKGESAAENRDNYGETNTQTEGVDEADIIKNDGRYLYVVGYDMGINRKLRIIDTSTMTAVYNGYIYNDSGDIIDIREIYITGNRLVAIGTYGENYGFYTDAYYSTYGGPMGGKTVSVVMDITDKASPKTIRKTEQDGSYRSSRMVGSVLYTITEYTVSGKDENEIKKYSIPEAAGSEITCDCIYIMDDSANRYICLTAYNTASTNGEVSSLAVLGSGTEVYCSQNNLYVLGTKYKEADEEKAVGNKALYGVTVINAFSLKGTEIAFKAQGEVLGTVNNQYNLDEYQGNLRIATTAYNYNAVNNRDVSSVYILDGDLKVIGKLEDIANDEQIKSVRYMGSKAYVVTFRNTDPLFVLDLTDPTAPKITGELKLPGYSAYMHPISETIILGVGYNGDSQNADFNSLKVSLFDVSDMANPKEISTLTYNNTESYVVQNPKAFVYNREENYIALPAQHYSNYACSGYSCYIIGLENNKLTLKHKFSHDVEDVFSGVTFLRGTYIGSEFFTVSDNLTVKHSLKSGEKLGECRIYVEKEKPTDTTVTANDNSGIAIDTTTNEAQTSAPYNPNN